jgi:thiosulfate dehydrogenase [quinone] large subunit
MDTSQYTKTQLVLLVILRVLIGWYFYMRDYQKFLPQLVGYGYLMDSKGIFASLFTAIAENPTLLSIANFANIYGSFLSPFVDIGFVCQCGANRAIFFLVLYYLSHPP